MIFNNNYFPNVNYFANCLGQLFIAIMIQYRRRGAHLMIASLNAQRQMREFSRRRIYTRLRRQDPGLDRDGEETYYETRRDDYASERNFVAAMRKTRREILIEMKRSLNSARSIPCY